MHSTSGTRIGLALLAGTAVAAVHPSARAELVVNGGFENVIPIGWSQQNGNAFPNYGYSGTQAHSGALSVFFANPFGASDQFFQNLPTVSGNTYTLSFWVFNAQQGSDRLRITWEGATVFDQLPLTIPLSQWTQFSVNVTANLNGSQLRLYGYDIPDRYYVDDVSVTQTPAPGAAGLVATAGLLAGRRRRKV